MYKYIFLLALLVFSCEKSDDSNEPQLETVTYTDTFSTVDEHESTYNLVAGRLKLTIVGSGGGGGGGSTNQGTNLVASYASGGGGGAGQVIVIDNIALGENPTLRAIIRAAGQGGTPNNNGSNGGSTEVELVGSSANPIGIALGGSGGQGGAIFTAGNGGNGYPSGSNGLQGSLSANPQQLSGGSGGDNNSNYGSGGGGGLGEATDNGDANSGNNGQVGFVMIEIVGERAVSNN